MTTMFKGGCAARPGCTFYVFVEMYYELGGWFLANENRPILCQGEHEQPEEFFDQELEEHGGGDVATCPECHLGAHRHFEEVVERYPDGLGGYDGEIRRMHYTCPLYHEFTRTDLF